MHADLAEVAWERMPETQSWELAPAEFAETDRNMGIMELCRIWKDICGIWSYGWNTSSCRIQGECWELRIRQLTGIFSRNAKSNYGNIMEVSSMQFTVYKACMYTKYVCLSLITKDLQYR